MYRFSHLFLSFVYVGIPCALVLLQPDMESLYRRCHCVFLLAKRFHPVMKYFAEVRQKIGKPTFFNILGPLLNPVDVDKQIIGTPFRDRMRLIAETCRLLGKKQVFVVCGEDGLDEVTITGKTYVTELKNNKIKNSIISPRDFGISSCTFAEISSNDVAQNIAFALSILKGEDKSRHSDLVLVNVALALKMVGKVRTLRAGYVMAQRVLMSGKPYQIYRDIIS